MTQAQPDALDSRALRPGMVIGGKFALLRRLGEGGVGVVFEAEDTWIGRRVALKVLHSHLTEEEDILHRFRREARAAAMTHHPNIVAVLEVGMWRDGSPYIVQELLEGETLRALIDLKHRLMPADVVEILVPIMGALVASHRAGIIHRDLKPENILLARTAEGKVIPKLIDFGVAKIVSTEQTTLTGSLLGTPAYMSPEQANGTSPADHRSDIWGLGAVMYELLAGAPPYDGPSGAVVLGKILTEPVTPLRKRAPDVPEPLAEVVDTALQRDPEQRFPSMAAMLDAVLTYAREPDPEVADRHRQSLPPPSPRRDRAPTDTMPEGTPAVLVNAVEEVAALPRSTSEWARPMLQPELGWYEGRSSARAPRNVDWYVAAAGQALRDNALDEAIDHAEHAIVTCRAAGATLGQMRLVQTTAYRWLGHYAESERCALQALETLPRATPGWYVALGHLAIIAGYLGNNEHLSTISASLASLEALGEVPAAHVVAACRLAVSLVRAGDVERATQSLASARGRAEAGTEEEPMVRAWIFVAIAELSMHGGDPAGYLSHLESAVTCFAEAGDARNACLQRANIGNGYLQLGAYARAKGLLREAIAVGEPMKLGFIAPVRANLGVLMARLGDLQQAFEIEWAALDQCVRERYRRFELVARIYLAVIYALREEPERAEGSSAAPSTARRARLRSAPMRWRASPICCSRRGAAPRPNRPRTRPCVSSARSRAWRRASRSSGSRTRSRWRPRAICAAPKRPSSRRGAASWSAPIASRTRASGGASSITSPRTRARSPWRNATNPRRGSVR
ncbi:Putative serine/threonine-protein kinase pknB [Minicystis rosea]|nr:Putative serine/threonine-protein kinase pknB [Minicystis rosea]